MFTVILIERTISREFELGLLRLDFCVDLSIGIFVVRYLGFGPVRLIAMRFTQGNEGVLQCNLRMSACIPEYVNDVVPMTLLAHIPHTLSNSPRIEAVLAGTGSAEDVEEFNCFQFAHRSILS